MFLSCFYFLYVQDQNISFLQQRSCGTTSFTHLCSWRHGHRLLLQFLGHRTFFASSTYSHLVIITCLSKSKQPDIGFLSTLMFSWSLPFLFLTIYKLASLQMLTCGSSFSRRILLTLVAKPKVQMVSHKSSSFGRI